MQGRGREHHAGRWRRFAVPESCVWQRRSGGVVPTVASTGVAATTVATSRQASPLEGEGDGSAAVQAVQYVTSMSE